VDVDEVDGKLTPSKFREWENAFSTTIARPISLTPGTHLAGAMYVVDLVPRALFVGEEKATLAVGPEPCRPYMSKTLVKMKKERTLSNCSNRESRFAVQQLSFSPPEDTLLQPFLAIREFSARRMCVRHFFVRTHNICILCWDEDEVERVVHLLECVLGRLI
jgi:hypothetical protein